MDSFSGTWTRGDDTLTLRQLGTRVVGWLSIDGEGFDVSGTLFEERLTLRVDEDEGAAKLSKGVLVVSGRIAGKGQWTREPDPNEVVGPSLQALGSSPESGKSRRIVRVSGTWLASGNVGQDTASWYSQLSLAEDDDGVVTGAFVRWIEGWSPEGPPSVRENLVRGQVAGQRDGAVVRVTLDRERYALRRKGERLVVTNEHGREELHDPIEANEFLVDPATFAGSWARGGNMPQDTGSWEQRLDIRVRGDAITGRFRETREGWTGVGGENRLHSDETSEFSGTVRDGIAEVLLDGQLATLRVTGESLVVENGGTADGSYGRA